MWQAIESHQGSADITCVRLAQKDTGRAELWQIIRRMSRAAAMLRTHRASFSKVQEPHLPCLSNTLPQCQLPADVVPHATCMSADALPAQKFSRL